MKYSLPENGQNTTHWCVFQTNPLTPKLQKIKQSSSNLPGPEEGFSIQLGIPTKKIYIYIFLDATELSCNAKLSAWLTD